MYFRFATLIALLSAVLATAQSDPNAFKTPTGGWQVTAGEPITLEWTPTTDSTVSLVLRNGAASDLNQGVTIASNLQNSGSYTWTPASNLPRRSDYVIEIVDDSDSSQVNYSPPFIVESTNVIQSTTVTSASASSTTGNSTASSSESSSSSGETPSTTTTGSSGTTVIVSNGTTRTATTGGAQTQSSTGASFQPTSASATGNSAARATAMAGMLGAVALGAFAI